MNKVGGGGGRGILTTSFSDLQTEALDQLK